MQSRKISSTSQLYVGHYKKMCLRIDWQTCRNNAWVNATVYLTTFTFNFKIRFPTFPKITVMSYDVISICQDGTEGKRILWTSTTVNPATSLTVNISL